MASERFVVARLPFVDAGEITVGNGPIRTDSSRGFERRHRLVQSSRQLERGAQVVVGLGKRRIAIDGATVGRNRIVETRERRESDAKMKMGLRMIPANPQCLAKLPNGFVGTTG